MLRILIFALHNSTDKIVTVGRVLDVPFIQKHLKDTYGGNWLRVDELNPNEYIYFSDNNIYKGFEVNKERYFNVKTFDNEITIKK